MAKQSLWQLLLDLGTPPEALARVMEQMQPRNPLIKPGQGPTARALGLQRQTMTPPQAGRPL
jgi:hypothetical protein